MQNVSLAMVEALYAENVEPLAILVSLTATGLSAPLLFTNYPGGSDANNPGLESNGQFYTFFPFQLAWGGAGQTEPVRQTQIVIGDGADVRIANAIRTAVGQPVVNIQAVRVSSPNVVEMAITNAVLMDAEIAGARITGTLKPREFDSEPACAARYTIARTPSLF
jgi:hypothetical protein